MRPANDEARIAQRRDRIRRWTLMIAIFVTAAILFVVYEGEREVVVISAPVVAIIVALAVRGGA